jgi:LDH2 family malate/lactate/ureidoglycolate dehydrogenase
MSQLGTEKENIYVLRPEKLYGSITSLCEKIGLPYDDATVMADAITMAHLRGVDTHGIRSLVNYVNRYKHNSFEQKAQNKKVKESTVSALIDGDNGLAISSAAIPWVLLLRRQKK